MRQIKFKAKSIEDGSEGTWVCGSLVEGYRSEDVFEEPTHFVEVEDADFDEHRKWRVDPDTVCQFTGLYDCEGGEVFENDLLYSDSWEPQYYVMEWNTAYACYEINPHQVPVTFADCFKNAGSKFDNPELLNE